jgi:hypothetical protein
MILWLERMGTSCVIGRARTVADGVESDRERFAKVAQSASPPGRKSMTFFLRHGAEQQGRASRPSRA